MGDPKEIFMDPQNTVAVLLDKYDADLQTIICKEFGDSFPQTKIFRKITLIRMTYRTSA
jgi:hypothetical protein